MTSLKRFNDEFLLSGSEGESFLTLNGIVFKVAKFEGNLYEIFERKLS